MPKASRKTTPKKDRSAEHETPAVYFRSIEVENVLCFKDKQVLNLSTPDGVPAQWTVILGDNGVGKTTLLRCLAGMELKQVSRRFFDSTSKTTSGRKKFYEPLLFQSPEHLSSWLRKLELSTDSELVSVIAKISYPIRLQSISLQEKDILRTSNIEVYIPNDLEMPPGIDDDPDMADMAGQLICYAYGAIRNLGKTSLSETLASENSLSLFVEGSELIDAEEWIIQSNILVKITLLGSIRSLIFSKRFFLM
jgi:hypothetical protein